MKLAAFIRPGGDLGIGAVEGNSVASLTDRLLGAPSDMKSLISSWSTLRASAEAVRGIADYNLTDIKLIAPIQRPGKIWGIGLNYADHVEEAGFPKPEHQTWFTKAITTIVGPYDVVRRPIASSALDYEGELVAVIGAGGKNLSLSEASTAIFGYCVGNDVSVRDWQLRSGQYSIGKSFDTHGPIGPWIVTADEIDPKQLEIRTFVNGECRQDSNTRHLIYDPAAQVEHLSQAMTLEPGDLIFTGTPGGVGAVMKPPQFLVEGDTVRVEISGIGSIENKIEDEI